MPMVQMDVSDSQTRPFSLFAHPVNSNNGRKGCSRSCFPRLPGMRFCDMLCDGLFRICDSYDSGEC